jgi:Transposase DDE domain group 1
MRANQMRLYLSGMAYILMSGLRRLGLKATERAQAQVSTIRLKLLKIGAQIRVSVRQVWVSMASSYQPGAYRRTDALSCVRRIVPERHLFKWVIYVLVFDDSTAVGTAMLCERIARNPVAVNRLCIAPRRV